MKNFIESKALLTKPPDRYLARHSRSKDVLERLSKDSNDVVRLNVAKNPNCPIEILERLSDDSDCYVRSHVISNKNCSVGILEKLSNDSDWVVRCHVLLNPNCPAEISERLSKDLKVNLKEFLFRLKGFSCTTTE